ncbi:MAG: PAS domain S-box protein, partial [Rhodospirillales bacterium]|nr:PAS domain S-box protein [Rhodospirillales bacterium]
MFGVTVTLMEMALALAVGISATLFVVNRRLRNTHRELQELSGRRRDAELALEESESRLEAFFQEAPAGLVMFDRELRYIKINHTLAAHGGLSPEEHVGKRFRDVVPEIAEAAEAPFRQVLETGLPLTSVITEAAGPTDLEPQTWLSSFFPLTGQNGQINGVGTVSVNITEQKNAEERIRRLNEELEERIAARTMELAHEKEKVENYLSIAGTMILALDSSGVVTMVNTKGCKVLGYEQDEIIGKNWFENFIDEAQLSEVKTAFSSIMSGDIEPVEHFENAVVLKDGGSRLIAWNNTYVRDLDGNIVGCLSAGEDITERKATEEALRISRERMNQSQEFANIGTWDWNVRTGELYWSDRIAPLFGYAKGELETTYENFVGAIHPDDRQIVQDAVMACVEKGEEYNLTHRVVWPDGTIRWLLEKGDVVRDAEGAPLNMLGVVQDVTEAKWAEDEIRRLGRRNRLILDAAGDGIYGLDMNGICTFINPAAAAMLGYEAEDLKGRELHKIVHHSHADGTPYPAADCPIASAFRDGGERSVADEVFWRKDGTSFSVDYTSTPIIEDGEIKGAVVVFRDVSERKEMQAQLVQSSKMATLGEMATGVAHELNQPLNVIRMAADNIRRKAGKGAADPGYLMDKLEKINGQIDRAAAIIDHMRIFGRKATSMPQQLDLRNVVRQSLGMIEQQLRLSDIEVRTKFCEDCQPVNGHQVQLEQVLLNLLGNARDAIKASGGEDARGVIDIIVSNEDEKWIRMVVRDSGGGIDAAVLKR